MHTMLLETPPTLHTLLTHSANAVDTKRIDATATPATSLAQHVLDATQAAAVSTPYDERRMAAAEQAWMGAPCGAGRNWQRLLAAQHLPTSMANIAAVATHLGVGYVQVLLSKPDLDVFYTNDTVAATLFGDNSFLVHIDGRVAVPNDWAEPVLHLEDADVEDIGQDIAHGRALVLAGFGLNLDGATGLDEEAENAYDRDLTPALDLVRVWHDHDDPPFEPGKEWSNLWETPIMDQLEELFLALGGPDSTVEFSVESTSHGNTPGIQEESFIYSDFPGDLFVQVAEATIDFSNLTGGSWEYNDGPDGRLSGYSFSGSAAYLRWGPETWSQANAHKRLGARAHLLEMARTDPRLAALRNALEETFHTTHKDATP
jgi:hypothetical protein